MDKVIMPSQTEYEQALSTAHTMRDHDHDTNHLAKTLLSHDARLKKLEHVLSAASIYLHSGLGGIEEHLLEMAIKEAKAAAYRPDQPLSVEDELLI